MKTILIAEHKTDNRCHMREYLEADGFHAVIASNGDEALVTARAEKPDLILLDIMLPEMSGSDFFKTYRKESKKPIILLTTHRDKTDKVLGLELGADDYIAKPFAMKDLTARINAVLHRMERPIAEPEFLSIGGIQLDVEDRSVKWFGRPTSLTPSEFDLLYILMSAPGKVFSRAELLFKLQGTIFEGGERTVDVHIRNLRTKIEPNPSEPIFIETVFGAGYKFHSE